MSFTVNDFQDLLNILQANPTWRDELRRVINGDEFDRMWKALEEMRQSVHELLEINRQNIERFKRYDQYFAELKSDVAVLKTDVSELKSDVSVLKTDVAVLKIDVAELKGDNLERIFRERPFVYLSRFARRLRVVDDAAFANIIEDALDAGRITAADAEDLKRIDAVAKGKNPDDGSDVYLALEVSYVADQHDLERAIRRAGLLALATGAHAKAVIAGKTITAGAMSLAEERGAYVVTRE